MSGVPQDRTHLTAETLTAALADTVVTREVTSQDQIIFYGKWTPQDAGAVLTIETSFKHGDVADWFQEILEHDDKSTGEVILRPKLRKVESQGVGTAIPISWVVPLGDREVRVRFSDDGSSKGTLDLHSTKNWLGPA
jgi:hypothetical protein